MDLLSDEILLNIISYLNFKSLKNLTTVSTKFKELAWEVIGKKCPNLKWRLDLFFPPQEIPEGVLILNYNRRKRRFLTDHEHRKYRKVSVVSNGISKQILQEYPTVNLKLPFNKLVVIDMIW